jgi:hypothetical protein
MRLLILALALSASTSGSAAHVTPTRDMPVVNPNGPASAICPPTSRYEAARRGGRLPPSLLNQLPAADMYSAVYRRIGGCEAPIIVRYDVGGATQNGR